MMLAVMFLLQRQLFVLPITRLTEWFHSFQKGETDELTPAVKGGELGRLASEVEQVALNLRVARKAVSQAATDRLEKEDLWTKSKLSNLINAKLGDNALFVVSNREPYMHILDEESGSVKCIRPAGGIVTAIDPILRGCGGMWIGHGAGNMDRKFVNSQDKLGVPPEDNRYILKRVWLTKEEEEGYYYGFSNEGLWPLCHITYIRPIFRKSNWQMYKAVNHKFAESVLKELPKKNAFVFIQDYHFTLLPKLIKQQRPDAVCAMFWHIPWPNPEAFAICPYYGEILEGMLGCDLIGFQTQFNCNNFIDTVNRLLESRIDTERFRVIRSGSETSVKAFPISIDYTGKSETPDNKNQIEEIKKEHSLEGKIIGVGVERIDYTKGIKERILAIDRFLEKYPEYKGRFVFIQLGAPSRTHIKSYHDLLGEIDELVEKKNWKYSEGGWKPIIYLKRHFSSEEIRPFYEMSDFCIVSSLHDGMNLVAKEYVAAKNDLNGVLILSSFTGAMRELAGAVGINPYDIENFADFIKFSIEMPEDEKKKRMEAMRKAVRENNVYRWASNIITELTALKKI
jgi:trehalose 6-phosphate synthase